MILDYEQFYRNYGIRRVTQLLQPRFGDLSAFQLPKRAVIHMAHGEPTKYGPSEQDFILRGFTSVSEKDGHVLNKPSTRPVWIRHITEWAQPLLGGPSKQGTLASALVRTYHQTHRKMRVVSQPATALSDETSLVVYNYDILAHLVKYSRSVNTSYFEWANIERTMWQEVARTAALSDRPQFIVRTLPQVLPARSLLQRYENMKGVDQNALKSFSTGEQLFLAELWKWFGKQRAGSLLAAIPDDKLHRVNIVLMESGKWMVFNLGVLNAWRAPTEKAPEDPAEDATKSHLIKFDQYQNRILRMFMSIAQLRSVAAPEVTDAANQVLDHDDAEDELREAQSTIVKVGADPARVDPLTGKVQSSATIVKVKHFLTEVEEPADTADDVKIDEDVEAQIDADLAELEKIQAAIDVKTAEVNEAEAEALNNDAENIPQESTAPVPKMERPSLDEAVMMVVDRLAAEGAISAAQYRQYEALSTKYKTIKAPDGISTVDQFINIPPEALKIEASKPMVDIATVPDKSMLQSSLLDFDERYIEEIMPRDVASMAMSIQRAGVAVTDYEVEKINSIMGAYTMHTLRVVPVEGASSTLRFKLPVIAEDGSYTANGVKYNLRKQRDEVPIRKTAPDTVTLTSYYGKGFVRRSEKKVNNYGMWLLNNLTAKMLDETDRIITNAHPGNMFDNQFVAPRLYSIFASGFNRFTFTPEMLPAEYQGTSFEMVFDRSKPEHREQLYGKDVLARYEQNGAVIAGRSVDGNKYLLIGKSSTVGIAEDGKITRCASIETLLGLPRSKAPVDCAVMKVSGENIPLGVILAYELGIEGLISALGAKVRRVPVGKRVNLAENEEAIVFQDLTIVFDRNDHRSAMFLAGFNEYHKHIRRFNFHLFNKKDVYLNVLEGMKLGIRYLREIDLLFQMFIDPITHDLLREMGEPTDMRQLLIRAGTMLVLDHHPDKGDAAFMRLKGYERMAGAVYSAMVQSVRSHNGRAGKHRLPINLDPHLVFTNIQTDASKAQVQDINPIQNLKEKEAVTYNGTGGRNSRTMTRETREYHANDMGTISGDTVDSSDVAINTYTPANPQFTSLRGLSRRYDGKTMGPTTLLSTSTLLSAGTDHDDPKRANFVGIQHSHTVACNGYHQMPVRTGYEQVIAQRTSDMYAVAAPQDGKVVSVTKTGVLVEFANGKRRGYEIGRRYGNAAGLMIPHELISNVQAGQEFKRGDILTYNTGFFEKDILNPKNVVWKAGLLAKTVLMEVPETLEDSSAISAKFAEKTVTKVTKHSDIVVTFDQVVSKLVKVGDIVESESILCIIEDAVTSQAKLFDAESLDTLKILSNQAPQAKVKGVVERIEVFYHGDKEDMSKSLSAIADVSDRMLAERYRSLGQEILTGSVDEAFRVDGEPLPYDAMCIRVYMTSDMSTGEGDKGVFANQMKSVIGKKFTGNYQTEKGETIDAIFGAKSIEDRIVHSPYIIGTTNVLLALAGKRMAEAYRS